MYDIMIIYIYIYILYCDGQSYRISRIFLRIFDGHGIFGRGSCCQKLVKLKLASRSSCEWPDLTSFLFEVLKRVEVSYLILHQDP